MPDKCTSLTRSQMMAGIKYKNTKPEIMVRKALFSDGFRYRLNNAKLPGKPDIVLKKHAAVIFVNGCFWHGHTCKYFVWPKTNQEFWKNKILGNRQNDQCVYKKLFELGYRVCVVWECITRDKAQFPRAIDTIKTWICSNDSFMEVSI